MNGQFTQWRFCRPASVSLHRLRFQYHENHVTVKQATCAQVARNSFHCVSHFQSKIMIFFSLVALRSDWRQTSCQPPLPSSRGGEYVYSSLSTWDRRADYKPRGTLTSAVAQQSKRRQFLHQLRDYKLLKDTATSVEVTTRSDENTDCPSSQRPQKCRLLPRPYSILVHFDSLSPTIKTGQRCLTSVVAALFHNSVKFFREKRLYRKMQYSSKRKTSNCN